MTMPILAGGCFLSSCNDNKFAKLAICDIHLHLDGALSPEAIIKVAKEENTELPTYNPKELKKYLSVDETCESLNEYLEKFDIPNLVMQTKYGIKEVTNDLLSRLAKQGLKYTEIRMAPQLSTNKGLTQDEVVSTLLEVFNAAEANHNIKARLILCLMRGASKEVNYETIRVAKKYLGQGVVCIDLAGAEAIYPNTDYIEEFAYARSENIPYILHAGEADGYRSVETALDMQALRIGHGIRSKENWDTVLRLAETKTPIEVCPKSNLDTKAVSSINDFKIKELLDAGVVVTLNTDNPTVSDTNLATQYQILEQMGISYEDAKQIALNTIESTFLSDSEKAELKEYLK